MKVHHFLLVCLVLIVSDDFRSVAGSSQLTVGDETVHNPLLDTEGLYEIVQKDAAFLPGKELPLGYVFRSVDGLGLASQCFYECRMDPVCKSFTHNDGNGSCFLNSKTYTEASPVDAPEGITLYDGDAFSIREDALGSCAQAPCKNGGMCLDKYDEATEKKDYECVCQEDWSGRTCETQAGVAVWEDWKPWSDCSVSCGTGYRERTRRCIDSLTKEDRNEQECWGCSIEIQLCTPKPCPAWEVWSTWSDCSTNQTCGPGIKTRTRSCTNGGIIDKDPGCFGRPTEDAPCKSPTCQTMIRLDGSSNYGEGRVMIYNDLDNSWGQVCGDGLDKNDADVSCHQVGLPRAAEVVTDNSFGISGEPYFLGNLQCDGTESAVQRCQHGGWASSMNCPGGPAKVKCVVNGAWNCWSAWGTCSVTCSDGIQTRTRLCDDPPNLNGGAACPGDGEETKPCNPGDCPVDGQWYPWLAWSDCSKNCGGGKQSRTRSCKQPENGGMICIGSASEEQECQTQPCPIDCTWKDWQGWGSCNASCGTGYMTRTRDWNEAKNNGKACEGESIDAAKCNENPCPVDGYWNAWDNWGSCDVTCGSGSRSRARTCQPPMHGGASCEGSNEEKGPCDMKRCLINGEWLPWGHWEKCSKTCEKGIRRRTRTCNMTSYGDLTTDCIGPSSGSQTCNEFDCGPAASCTELKIRGLEEDSAVMIDPDGDGPNAPIEAHCDMTGEDGVTEIWHNYMNETLVENFQGSHLFFRSLGYDGSVTADHPQLVKLIAVSASCKQFISFKCKGATFKDDAMTYTYWVNRDDKPRWYWGGGRTIEPYGCNCDLAGSCAAPKVTCNCNIGDDVWREDSGYITNVDDLPVRKFFVGNTGDGKQGLIAVGPLLCWGTKG